MSRIDDLIHELCPEGVPFRELKEVAKIRNGKDYKSFPAGPIPVFGTGGVMTSINRAAYAGPSVLIPRKGSLNQLYFVDEPFWTVDTIFYTEIDEIQVRPKFFYYYLKTQRLEELNQAGGIPSLTQRVLNRLLVPAPPLEVQDEIVRILDTFSALEAELEAELEARRTQYEHYRATLLSSDELLDGGWTSLGELANFRYGQTAKAADRGDVRFIRITDISEQGKLRPNGAKYLPATEVNHVYQVERGDVLIARTGASFGKSVLIGGETGSYASFLIRLRFNEEKVLPQYFWHFAQSSLYWEQAERLVSRGGQPQFNANVLKALRMPVPALHKQREVAMLLNSFDALVNDLTSGLPAEIDARRRQYEYYRDRLLTFEEAPT